MLSWTQSDPKYRCSPDRAYTDPRLANLYSTFKNNPMRFLDPDGRDPKTINVVLQNLTRSSPTSQDVRERRIASTAALVSQTIQNSFSGNSYFASANLMLQHGNAKAAVSTTSEGRAPAIGKGIQIVLADLQTSSSGSTNPASVGAASDAGVGHLIGKMRSMQGTHALAYAEVNGNKILISVDRILEKIDAERLDLNDPKDQEKIRNVLEHMITHELGHTFGLLDNDSTKGLLMNTNTPSFSDEIMIAKMKGEIEKLSSSISNRAH